MPELAEVETTRRDLNKIVLNKKINSVRVYLDKIVYNKKEEFINRITGRIINSINRRGKWLIFELDDSFLITHFRMEGRFYLKEKNCIREKHDYIIFDFDDFSLHYNDPRLFGKMEVIDKAKLNLFFQNKNLGLEYFDEKLTPNYLKDKFKTHHTYIKNMLLDQSFITGIGNIYADEILFRSKIHPKSLCDILTNSKLKKIIDNTKIVFEESLKYKGTYPNIDGKRGTYEEHLLVHKRENQACFKCGKIIKKEKVGGRGTYFCPKCQVIYK